jgi:hypothetical protein
VGMLDTAWTSVKAASKELLTLMYRGKGRSRFGAGEEGRTAESQDVAL